MTDVAALIAEARRYSEAPSTVDALAAEIDRLTAVADEHATARIENAKACNRVSDMLTEAKAEIARVTSDLSDLEEVHETLKAETKRADYWKAKADEAKAEIVRLGEALTTALLYIDFEPIRPELEAILKPDTGELDPGKSASSTRDPDTGEYAKGVEDAARVAESGLTLDPSHGEWIALNIRALKPDTGE